MATQFIFPAQAPWLDEDGRAHRRRKTDTAANAIVGRLKDVRIATASSVLLSINLVLLICACLLFLFAQTANNAAETALRGRSAQLEVAHELGRTSSQMTRLARIYVVSGEERYSRLYERFLAIRKGQAARPRPYNDIHADLIIAGRPFNALGRTVSLSRLASEAGYSAREFALFKQAERAADALTALENQATRRVADGRLALLMSTEHGRAIAAVTKPLAELIEHVEARSGVQVAIAQKRASHLVDLLIATICLAAGVAAATAWSFVSRVVGPLCRLSAIVDRTAQDGAEPPIPFADRGDEIGQMARALLALREATDERDRLQAAKQSLTRRRDDEAALHRQAIEAAAARATRAAAVEALVDSFSGELLDAMGAVRDASGELNECAQTMTLVANGTERRVAEAEEGGRDTAAHVHTVADTCRQLARATGEIEAQTLRSMASADRAVDAVRRTTATVDELRLHSQGILGIVALIGRIAAKTNRLAINATIEAAHAGEAGRGFAVVASEVKSLARQTADAASQIADQLGAVHEASQETVLMVDDIATSIAQSREISRAIGSAVEQQASATGRISVNADRAAERTRQSAASMATIRLGAQHTHQAIERMVGAATALTGTSDAMRDFVDRFADDVRRT